MRNIQVKNFYPLEIEHPNFKQLKSLKISKITTKKTIKYHHYLRHVNQHVMKDINKFDINIPINISHLFLCKSYLVGKQHKNFFFKDKTLCASKPLKFFHTNIRSLIQIKSIKGFICFFICIEDYLRFTAIYVLKHKFEVFQTFQAYTKNHTNYKIKTSHSNNGGE